MNALQQHCRLLIVLSCATCLLQGPGIDQLVQLLLQDSFFARAVQQQDGHGAATAAVGVVRVSAAAAAGAEAAAQVVEKPSQHSNCVLCIAAGTASLSACAP
jgi:hypothetical protein